MKKLMIWLAGSLLTLTIAAQDVQVPIEQTGEVITIDTEWEDKLQLFTPYPGFQSARLFRQPSGQYELLIFYQPGDSLMKKSIVYTAAEAQVFRQQVTQRFQQHAPEAFKNQDGRTLLMLSSSVVSLGYYGWTVPRVLEVNDEKAFIGLYMLTSGAGFFVPFTLSKNLRMTPADATMTIYGQTRGIGHGALLSVLIDDQASERTILGMGMLGSIGEAIGGYQWSKHSRVQAGAAATLSAMGDFGAGLGFSAAHLSGFLDNEQTRGIAASLLLGSAAGLGSGYWLSRQTHYSTGDAYMLRGAGVMGAYSLASLAIIAEPDNPKWYSATATAGALGGIAIGHYMAGRNNYTGWQGVLIGLGEIAGGLVGLGTGYLVSPDTNDAYKLFIATSAMGTIGGFTLMSQIFSKQGHVSNQSQAFHLSMNPLGLVGLAAPEALPAQAAFSGVHFRWAF